MLNSIPRIDVYQINRNNLKILKLRSSVGMQTRYIVEKTNHIAKASQGAVNPNDFDITLADTAKKKLNIIF